MKPLILALAFSVPFLSVSGATAKTPHKTSPAAQAWGHRSAAAQAPATAESCLDARHFLQHAAYIPAEVDPSLRCGHFLSTDTMMTIHHRGDT
jgi:hypothetical protein